MQMPKAQKLDALKSEFARRYQLSSHKSFLKPDGAVEAQRVRFAEPLPTPIYEAASYTERASPVRYEPAHTRVQAAVDRRSDQESRKKRDRVNEISRKLQSVKSAMSDFQKYEMTPNLGVSNLYLRKKLGREYPTDSKLAFKRTIDVNKAYPKRSSSPVRSSSARVRGDARLTSTRYVDRSPSADSLSRSPVRSGMRREFERCRLLPANLLSRSPERSGAVGAADFALRN